MKYLFILAGVVCLSFMLLPACAPQVEQEAEPVAEEAPSTEADLEALQAHYESFDRAFNQLDVDGVVSHYTDDAVRLEADTPAWVGKEAIRAGWKSAFDQFDACETTDTVEDVVFSGEWAFARISWSGTYTFKGGEPIQLSGKAISLCKRQPDGSWKIVWDIWNADAPLPELPNS